MTNKKKWLWISFIFKMASKIWVGPKRFATKLCAYFPQFCSKLSSKV